MYIDVDLLKNDCECIVWDSMICHDKQHIWTTDEITCLRENAITKCGGVPLSVIRFLDVQYINRAEQHQIYSVG